MKIIIDIPEEVFDEIYNKNYYSLKGKEALRVAVRNGTPLPNGHGRLIDGDRLLEHHDSTEYFNGMENRKIHFVQIGYIHDAPTIIEADTTRDCKTCEHSNGGKCAGTEECHACMWENNYIEADKEGEQE